MKTSSFDGFFVFRENNWETFSDWIQFDDSIGSFTFDTWHVLTWQVLPVECPHALLVVLTGLSVELGDISDEKKEPFSLNPRCRSDHFIVICRFEGRFLEVPACAETLVSAWLKQASPGQQRRHIIFMSIDLLSWKKTTNLQSQSPWKGFTSFKKIKDFHFSRRTFVNIFLTFYVPRLGLVWAPIGLRIAETLRWERNPSLCWYQITISICACENKSQSATSRCNIW